MAHGELERTRVDLVVPPGRTLPPGTRMLVGRREDLDEMMETQGFRAVGRYQPLSGGATGVPVVYVGRRHLPFYVRHRKGLLISGGILSFLSALALLILWTGPWVFFGGVAAAALFIALITRISRGGGRSVSVTTTTTTKVRVR